MEQKVYERLAQITDARLRCKAENNLEWFDRHEESIENIVREKLPTGSGIDAGNRFDFDKSNGERLVINSSFHKMDSNGFYDGWIDYAVTVLPSLFLHFDLKITGNFGKRQDIKDYLYDVYYDAFNETYS